MAGMLPGVECARRRRFHQSSEYSPAAAAYGGCSRRSSFCLYTTSSHEPFHSSTSSLQRSILNKVYEDEKLGGVARQAKERLDERLGTQRKCLSIRQNDVVRGTTEARPIREGEILQTEIYGSKKSNKGSKKFWWTKLSWKAAEQDECTICLERFKRGEALVHLPCAHKFHGKCLVPWLETNAHCPCCRMQVHVQLS